MFLLIPAILAVTVAAGIGLSRNAPFPHMQDAGGTATGDSDASVFQQDPFEIPTIALEESERVRFRLADGVRIQGVLESWHEHAVSPGLPRMRDFISFNHRLRCPWLSPPVL